MKVHEAIAESIDDEKWFRPCSWRGKGRALVINIVAGWTGPHILQIVPRRLGDDVAVDKYTPTVEDLTGDWELVDPLLVHREFNTR